MVKWLSLFLGIAIGVSLFLSWKWYAYVTNTRSPYDEVGIELNGFAPRALNEWGCARLMASFPQAVPPTNCEARDGRWPAPPTPTEG